MKNPPSISPSWRNLAMLVPTEAVACWLAHCSPRETPTLPTSGISLTVSNITCPPHLIHRRNYRLCKQPQHGFRTHQKYARLVPSLSWHLPFLPRRPATTQHAGVFARCNVAHQSSLLPMPRTLTDLGKGQRAVSGRSHTRLSITLIRRSVA